MILRCLFSQPSFRAFSWSRGEQGRDSRDSSPSTMLLDRATCTSTHTHIHTHNKQWAWVYFTYYILLHTSRKHVLCISICTPMYRVRTGTVDCSLGKRKNGKRLTERERRREGNQWLLLSLLIASCFLLRTAAKVHLHGPRLKPPSLFQPWWTSRCLVSHFTLPLCFLWSHDCREWLEAMGRQGRIYRYGVHF